MDDLIAALQVFRRYTDSKYPTSCEHDLLYVHVDPNDVSDADLTDLHILGFDPSDDGSNFYSSKYGSA